MHARWVQAVTCVLQVIGNLYGVVAAAAMLEWLLESTDPMATDALQPARRRRRRHPVMMRVTSASAAAYNGLPSRHRMRRTERDGGGGGGDERAPHVRP